MKLSFDGSRPSIKLYEIFVKERARDTESPARTALNTLYTAWAKEDLSVYTPDSAKGLLAALDAAKAVLDKQEASVSEVSRTTVELVTAIGALEYGVQKVHLETVLDFVDLLLALEHHYDAADIEELKAAQLAGQLVFNDPEATQDEADAATYAILDVLAKLSKTADVE